jgi:hypothetical protein
MKATTLDAAGHRRSPATMPGYHRGRPPRNKGEQYPADRTHHQPVDTPSRTDELRRPDTPSRGELRVPRGSGG